MSEDKTQVELMSTLNSILETNAEIKASQDGIAETSKSAGELATAQKQAIEALDSKFKELEKANARKSIEAQSQSVDDAKSKKEKLAQFNQVCMERGVKNFTPITDFSKAEAISASYSEYIRMGCNVDSLDLDQKTLLNSIISPEGGYIVAPEFSQTIVNRAFDGHGIMDIVSTRQISGNSFIVPIDEADYDNAEYLNELANGVSGEHTPDYNQVTYSPTEQIYKFRISRVLLEDGLFNVENDVLNKGREGAGRQTATQIVIGNGVDRPKGILAYADGTGFDKLERIESDTAGQAKWKDVLGVLPSALKDPYHSNAKYAMRRSTFFNDLLTDTDGAGQFQIMNQINFFSGEGAGMFIMGHEVVFDAAMGNSSVTAADAILFGDFSEAYTFVERIGFSLIVDNVTSGQFITYRLRRRNDGRLVMGDALKSLKIKA